MLHTIWIYVWYILWSLFSISHFAKAVRDESFAQFFWGALGAAMVMWRLSDHFAFGLAAVIFLISACAMSVWGGESNKDTDADPAAQD